MRVISPAVTIFDLTPYELAIYWIGRRKIFRLLLERGADLDVKNKVYTTFININLTQFT